MEIDRKFANRRLNYLRDNHTKLYVEMLQAKTLNDHLNRKGAEGKEMMIQLFNQMKPQLDKITDPEQREIQETQMWLMAEEMALHEVVLSL